MIYEIVQGLSKITTSVKKVLPDILMLDFTIVKIYMIKVGKNSEWVLVDTGLDNSYDLIKKTAEEHFGSENRPKAIILTHGHFDHIGSVIKLSEYWDINVYAHELEIPYLNGQKDYPKGDPLVDEGLIAKMSPFLPHYGINLGKRIIPLSADGNVQEMNGWKWIHTPGHTEGHISLIREADKVLIVGDAFTTTKQESLLSVLSKSEDIKGPPAYLTTNWVSAKLSIEKLEKYNASIALPSHGDILMGIELSNHLKYLIENFNDEAVPSNGKYVEK